MATTSIQSNLLLSQFSTLEKYPPNLDSIQKRISFLLAGNPLESSNLCETQKNEQTIDAELSIKQVPHDS